MSKLHHIKAIYDNNNKTTYLEISFTGENPAYKVLHSDFKDGEPEEVVLEKIKWLLQSGKESV